MHKFEFLKEPFLDWLKEQQSRITKIKNLDFNKNTKDCYSLWDDFDIDKIDKHLIEIIKEIDLPDVISLILQRMSYFYEKLGIFKYSPTLCEIKFNLSNLPNALNWTLVNIKELNFFDTDNLNIQIPYNQCHYCGKPYYFEYKYGNKKFNKKTKYCHDFDCNYLTKTDGSNPLLHENCCFGKYAQSKKKLYQKMKAKKVSKEDKIKTFITYCNKKLRDNEKIEWTIQTKNKDAIYQDDWYEEDIMKAIEFHYPTDKIEHLVHNFNDKLNLNLFTI